MELDEGTAIAVFLLLWIDTIRADMGAARKHLKGFHLILQELRTNHKGLGPSPLILDIYRIVFRLDWTTSFFLGEEPIFPSISNPQQPKREWMEWSVDKAETSEWAMTAFVMDDLMNQACRTSAHARQIRRSTGYTSKHEAIIQSEVAKLEEHILAWRQSPLIQMAELVEQAAQPTASPKPGKVCTFLDYPALQVFNSFYVNLLNASRAILIYISLIANPMIGFATVPNRFSLAVEISRAVAALENDKILPISSRLWMIYLTGVAFGGRQQAPREVEWLTEKVDDIAKLLPLTTNTFKAGILLWDFEGDFWDALAIWKDLMRG
jgi:hypothetical protein